MYLAIDLYVPLEPHGRGLQRHQRSQVHATPGIDHAQECSG